ncbi:MAG: ArnT family glycosyltransferase [Thermoanaerobaculales bacterium]
MNPTAPNSVRDRPTFPLPLALFLVAVLLTYLAMAIWGLRREPWHDERHFIQAATVFGNSPTLDTLRHYEELAPPLTFVVFGLWGRIVGFSVPLLRILSLMIAFATALCCFSLFSKLLRNDWHAVAAALFVMLNPYMLGASLFVFTDMPAILCEMLVMLAVVSGKPWLLGFSLAGAILCRQYLVFLTLAVGLLYLFRLVGGKIRSARRFLVSTCLSVVPLVSLMIFWGGISPQNQVRHQYLGQPLSFHWAAFSLYVCQVFIYLSPIIVLRWKKFYTKWQYLLLAVLSFGIYWLIPVRASIFAAGYARLSTVGYFHRCVRVFLTPPYDQIPFAASFAAAIPVLLVLVAELIEELRMRSFPNGFLLKVSILSFLVIMPFSYLTWEKYFLPVLPLLVILLLSCAGPLRSVQAKGEPGAGQPGPGDGRELLTPC